MEELAVPNSIPMQPSDAAFRSRLADLRRELPQCVRTGIGQTTPARPYLCFLPWTDLRTHGLATCMPRMGSKPSLIWGLRSLLQGPKSLILREIIAVPILGNSPVKPPYWAVFAYAFGQDGEKTREIPCYSAQFTETRSRQTASTATLLFEIANISSSLHYAELRRHFRGLSPSTSQQSLSETRNATVSGCAWANVSSGVNRGGRIGNSSRAVGTVFVRRDPGRRAAPASRAAGPETCATAASR